MMDCQTCQEVISAALDGEAADLAVEMAQEHLAACAFCGEFERAAGALQQFVHDAPAPQTVRRPA